MDDRRHSDAEEVRRHRNLDRSAFYDIRHRPLRRAAGGVCLFILLFVSGCSSQPGPSQSIEAPLVRIGVPEGEVAGSDVGLPQIARSLTLEGLTTKAYDGRPVPRLAKSWTASPDGLTWRFTLRDDVKFHDGSHLDVTAAQQSLKASLARPGTAARYPGLADVVDVAVEGAHDLIIKLKARSAFLVDDLELTITKRNAQSADDIGTGAFRTASSSKEEIIMEPNRDYYLGTPRVGNVIIRAYPTLRTAWASMMRDEIDVLFDVAQDAAEFVGSTQIDLYPYLRPYVYLIAFNSSHRKLASAPVRRALNASIDRNALIRDVLKGRGQPASGPLWPHHWAHDNSIPGYSHDPSLAAATLDAAGLKSRHGTQASVPARFSFTCLVPQKYIILERLALNVQKQLYDIGVDMQLQSVSADEYVDRIGKGNFEAIIVDMISGPTFARPYLFWRSRSGFSGLNSFGYNNAAADRWFDALRYAAGETEYRAAASQLRRTLLEDPPALFLAWNERSRAISRRFKVPGERGRDPLANLWQWTPQGTPGSPTH